jgi:hypothetical protein
VQVPALFHAVDLQMHDKAGSLKVESVPAHSKQSFSLIHPIHLLLQAISKLIKNIY